ncbi:MAG TPA: GNAT family N-acetyltransferase [Gemmatimonadaceae bacterium]|nr:GNAT family N-acetyltransferase [Gemmatimonadaceae bacterium]
MPLSAAFVPMEEVAHLLPEVALERIVAASSARPPRGFGAEAGPPAVAVVRDGADIFGVALLRWYRLWLAPRRYCRLALVPCVVIMPEGAAPDRLDLTLRVLLDALTRTDQPAHVISIWVSALAEERVDRLWRLALALNARCVVRDRGSELSVDLVLPGVRGELGASLAAVLERRILSRTWARIRSRRGRRSIPPRSEAQAFFVRDLDAPVVEVISDSDAHISEISAADLARRPARYGYALLAAATSAGNARCFAATVGNEVVFRMWTVDVHDSLVMSAHQSVLSHVDRPAALIFSAFTAPEHRGRSIYPAALSWLARRYQDAGYRNLCLFARLDNPPALRAAEKAGFRRVV